MVFLESIFDKKPWQYLKDNSWTDEPTLRNLAVESYQLLIVIGIGLISISIVLLILRWACGRREDRRNQVVMPVINKLLVVMALGGFVYLINLVWWLVDRFAAQLVL